MASPRLTQLLAFLAEDPSDAFTRFALALEYQKQGAPQEALAAFQWLVDHAPAYIGTYYHFGKLMEALDQPEKAIKLYRAGIEQAKRQRDRHAEVELKEALVALDQEW